MKSEMYQTLAMRTCQASVNSQQAILEAALGLNGEAGEVADIVKKSIFGGHPMDRTKLILELGDVLWYVTEMAHGLGISLDQVMTENIRNC